MRSILILAAVVTLATACSGHKGPDGKKLAALCVEASNQLDNNSGDADTDTFMMMVQNALQACSGGCDASDDASCKLLDSHIQKVCGAADSVCTSLCSSVKSPSLKKATCEFKKSP